MSNIIDEITQADQDLRQAEIRATEASARLRRCKHEARSARAELSRLILELRTGESRYRLLERIEVNGERVSANGSPIDAEEHDQQKSRTTENNEQNDREQRPSQAKKSSPHAHNRKPAHH